MKVTSQRPTARVRRTIPAGKFKLECLRLIELVNETGEEIVITKRNRPVAMLGPVPDAEFRPFVGRSRGVIHASRADILGPVSENWEVGADL